MEREEDSVRVWVGLNLLQAQMLKQTLLDNGIECSADRAMGVFPAGELDKIGLWVGKKDEARARALLVELEKEMSVGLDSGFLREEERGQG